MVPTAPSADAEAAAASPNAAWLERLRAILDVSRGGLVVLLSGAHAAAAKPLVETLLEGHAPDDPEAPCVRICFTPSELLEAPAGARVVLVGAEREPEWLNLHRPVVYDRSLVLLLWVNDGGLEPLRRNAPDFLDWVSHRVEVPRFAREGAAAELQRALSRVRWVAIAGAKLVEVAAEGRREVDAAWHYDELVSAMEGGDVLVQGLRHDDQLWRLLIAHAEVQWRHRVVLVEPELVPPFTWLIDARIEDWEASARRWESIGVEHARLKTALARNPGQPLLVRGLHVDDAHLELLARVAHDRWDEVTERLARETGLDDVVEGLRPTTWADEEITPERIVRGLRGGRREQRALADYVTSVVEQAVILGARARGLPLDLWPDLVQDVITDLYRDGGRVLRAWDPARAPFPSYLRMVARRHTIRTARRYRAMEPIAASGERGEAPDVLNRVMLDHELEPALAGLSEQDRAIFDDYFVRGLSASEIAKGRQVSVGSVRKRLERITARLRALVDDSSPRNR